MDLETEGWWNGRGSEREGERWIWRQRGGGTERFHHLIIVAYPRLHCVCNRAPNFTAQCAVLAVTL